MGALWARACPVMSSQEMLCMSRLSKQQLPSPAAGYSFKDRDRHQKRAHSRAAPTKAQQQGRGSSVHSARC